MSRYPQNQPIRLSTTVRDVTGALVDAGALTLLVKLAAVDGTWTTTGTYAAPAHDGVGLYHQDIPVTDLATIGHYQYTWTSTGTGAGVSFGEFEVHDPFETAVLSLQDAKDQLNIPQATTTNDAEIAAYVSTIEASLRAMTGGPIVNRVITAERCEFSGRSGYWYQTLQVRQRPLVGVTSITSVLGTVIDVSALDINPASRIIRRKDASPFSSDSPVALVTYTAGWGTAVPASLNLAAKIILQHLWDTQHGPAARPSMGAIEVVTPPGFGFAVPNYAAELLQGHLNGMAFADSVFAW